MHEGAYSEILALLEPDSVFLVTGGAGFIGSNICDVLVRSGFSVRCFDDLSTGARDNIEELLEFPNFTFIEDSIVNFPACLQATAGVSYVLHQAAWGSVPRSIKLPLEYQKINIQGTLNLLEAARQNAVERFVYASSSSVYGDHPALPKAEGIEGEVLSPYALTKRVDEMYGRLYHSVYGLETCGLRYFNVFGPNQNPLGSYAAVIPRFIYAALNDQTVQIHGDGMQSRDFTYIANVVQANLKACIAPPTVAGNIYNIAAGSRTTILGLYEMICDRLASTPRMEFIDSRPGDIKHSFASISKAGQELGYSPTHDLEEGLALTIEWYRKKEREEPR